MLSDRSKPHVPTREDIEHIVESLFPSLERDWGKKLDDRLCRVLKHHMTAVMIEVRNKTLDHKMAVLTQQLFDIEIQKEV